MSGKALGDLTRLAEALYLKEHAAIRDVLEQEARIAARFEQLDVQSRLVAAQDPECSKYRHLGAEVQWKAWENHTRKALNTQLAQVRMLKEQRLAGYHDAAARKSALEALNDRERDRKKRDRSTRSHGQLVELAMHTRCRKQPG